LTEIKRIARPAAAGKLPAGRIHMQILLFTVLAVVLYVAADRMLDAMERRAGRRFEYRSVYFFVILLVLAIVAFSAVQRFASDN
jgi:cytochrome c biogenesis factor